MLISIQIPFADVRSFAPRGKTSPRLPRPRWEHPRIRDPNSGVPGEGRREPFEDGFIHYYGIRAVRYLGPGDYWKEKDRYTDDADYCRANGAIQLPELGTSSLAEFGPTYVFRRLFFDNLVVGRFEIGVSFKNCRALDGGRLHDLVVRFLGLATGVPRFRERPPRSANNALFLQGNPLARLYYQATSPQGHTVERDASGVFVPIYALPPMVFVEYRGSEVASLPRDAKTLPETSGAKHLLANWSIGVGRRLVGGWLLNSDLTMGSNEQRFDPRMSPGARNVRLCVFRMHAEHQVYKKVNDLLDDGTITYEPRAKEAPLNQYMSGATSLLRRSSFRGAPTGEIVAAIKDYSDFLTASQRLVLIERQQGWLNRVKAIEEIEPGTNPSGASPRFDPDFDVFLCHNSLDKEQVRALAEVLKGRGLHVWLDEVSIEAGDFWQGVLDEQITAARLVAIFLGDHGYGPYQADEVDQFLYQVREHRCRVIPVVLPGTSPGFVVPTDLSKIECVDFRNPVPDPLARLCESVARWAGRLAGPESPETTPVGYSVSGK